MYMTTARIGRRLPALALIATALAAGACAPSVPEVAVVQPAPAGAFVTTAAVTPASVSGLVVTMNNATIAKAQVAQSRASDARVRDFAGRILAESRTASAVINNQLARHGIAPVQDAMAQQIERNATQTVSMLQSARGLDVDWIFLESEIADTRWLISTIDAVMPAVADDDAREAMAMVRSAMGLRLAEAQRLQSEVFNNRRSR